MTRRTFAALLTAALRLKWPADHVKPVTPDSLERVAPGLVVRWYPLDDPLGRISHIEYFQG